MSKSSGVAHTRKPTAEEIAAEATAAHAVDAVNPGDNTPAAEAHARLEDEQIQIDPQLFQQAIQNKNARLIAMVVNEAAMLEVALEQSRRDGADWRNKYEALLASLKDD